MKKIVSLFGVFLIFVIITSSCNLPAKATQPVSAPSNATPASPDATPTPTETPIPPVSSLMDNLKSRVASGEWTLEQGLVTTLDYVAGKASDADINPQGNTIVSMEGSPIILAAMAYIQDGKDETTRTELQKTLDYIFPDTAKLERYSKPASKSYESGQLQLVSHKSQTVDCTTLWENGFPADSATTCFQYRSVTVAGKEYRLFIPTDLNASDPRSGLADIIMDGIPTAVNKFLEFGDMPPTDLVFTLFPYRDRRTYERMSVDAAAIIPTRDANCQIAIFPLIGENVEPGAIQQIIAHELFHCFQFKNYRPQMLIRNGENTWWTEGTAEFFSNVAFPTVNEEHEFTWEFDELSPDHSIVDIDYPNFVFFQFLEGQIGDEGIIQLISQMPTSGGRAEQIAALANYPNMKEYFHEFGRAYLDGTIQDTGGGFLPVSPDLGTAFLINQSGHTQRSIPDFVVNRRLLIFPADTVHTITSIPDSSVMDRIRPNGGARVWSMMPTSLRGCSERQMVWLATRAESDGSEGTIDFTVDVQNQNVECDQCLVGRWQLNTGSYWNAVQTLLTSTNLPGMSQIELTLQSIEGDAPVLEFTSDDKGVETFNNFQVHYTEDRTNNGRTSHGDANIKIDGVSTFDWSTDSSVTPPALNIDQIYSQPTFDNHVTITTSSGVTIDAPVPMSSIEFPSSGTYSCNETTLEVNSSMGVPIQYDRLSH